MATMANNQLVLPDDIFDYENEAFYNFVHNFIGSIEAEILKVQSIRNARLLLLIPDVFSFFELECDDVIDLKKRACFIMNNNTYVVKSGIRFSIDYLFKLVRSKNLIQSSSVNNCAMLMTSLDHSNE